MDPLSITAAVVGILGAAQKVTSGLNTFTRNTGAAPDLARSVLVEVTSTTAVLSQLQSLLLGTTIASKTGASLILVEQVIVVLTECVKTFSELEDTLGTSGDPAELRFIDKVKWGLKEPQINSIQQRLQSNKMNLTLMLTILQCKALEDAKAEADKLHDRIGEVLSANEALKNRLMGFDEPEIPPPAAAALNKSDDSSVSTTSDHTSRGPQATQQRGALRKRYGFAFEEELFSSRVYKKSVFSQSGTSLITAATRNTCSSVLSSLSISEVSNLSVLAVPIYANEISNSQRYIFGDFSSPPQANVVKNGSRIGSRIRKWSGFRNTSREKNKPADTPTVFGAPLDVCLRHAGLAISYIDDSGNGTIIGYIPVIVGKTGLFLKEKATEVENIFSISGSPTRVKLLEDIFNRPDRYGKGHDWSGYTAYDAASLLIRYLTRLPESLIPPSFYERFHEPLRNHQTISISDVMLDYYHPLANSYATLVQQLPDSNRRLLLYILDILCVFGSHSDTNKMTPRRLAIIFQPSILSPVQTNDGFIEESTYRSLSQAVVEFLIEIAADYLLAPAPVAAPTYATKLKLIRRPSTRPNTPSPASRMESTPKKSQLKVPFELDRPFRFDRAVVVEEAGLE
ncbi:hypothetical protein AJ79_01126 [Helicocarpus griseus UAMH5409]|uniref:Rho-GAP domain-containing protein n=1 Tax=Helicocarpus griseus UAMH5409 TaxID=1447875 RepID=A0A2B7Y7Q5_9EURO|nr:hypothetical protein AJ79_01126 [Helicocarpus griseus UAMH5409]